MRSFVAKVAFLALVACRSSSTDSPSPLGTREVASSAPQRALRFIEDDVETAKAEAARAGKLLFVDVWAPWCHTCLSMKNFVLNDPSLGSLDATAVFASIDYDKPRSAAFLGRYAVKALPTLLLVDPLSGEVVAAKSGSASVAEVRAMVTLAAKERGGEKGSAAWWLTEAVRARARGAPEEAVERFRRALDAAPEGSGTRSQAALGLVESLAEAGRHAECADAATKHATLFRGSSIPADAATTLLGCAEHLEGEPKNVARGVALGALRAFVNQPPAGASIDDRGDASSTLAEALEANADGKGARAVREAWLAMLEDAAKRAPDVEAAHTFDYQRANALVALGRGGEAVPLLTEREKQLPKSYEPAARLARVFAKLERYAEAEEAIERAIARAYGPRRLLYLRSRAEIAGKLGKREAELETLREEVKGWAELPPGQAAPKQLADARARLAAAEKAGAREER